VALGILIRVEPIAHRLERHDGDTVFVAALAHLGDVLMYLLQSRRDVFQELPASGCLLVRECGSVDLFRTSPSPRPGLRFSLCEQHFVLALKFDPQGTVVEADNVELLQVFYNPSRITHQVCQQVRIPLS
jgi:hypothetical protein